MSADDHDQPPHLVGACRRGSACPRIVERDGRQGWLYEDEFTHIQMGSCRPLEGSRTSSPASTRSALGASTRSLGSTTWTSTRCTVSCASDYARFAGHRFFLDVQDHELALACLQVYNDYLLDEWCAVDPERMFGAVILPLHDIDLAAAELDRVIAKGAKAIAFSENPTVLGLPSVHSGHWDPLWDRASEAEVPVCLHIGSSSKMTTTSNDAPGTVLVTLNRLNSMMAGVDWLMSGILDRFTKLRSSSPRAAPAGSRHPGTGRQGVPRSRIQPSTAHRAVRQGRNAADQLLRAAPVSRRRAFHALASSATSPSTTSSGKATTRGDGLWPHNHAYLEKALADVPDAGAVQDRGDEPPGSSACELRPARGRQGRQLSLPVRAVGLPRC
jgi:hypothetical protein